MKVKFIIDSPLFKRSMAILTNWNFPHLPRVGEQISPHVIMFQEEFTYHNVLKYMTEEAKNDFNKFNNNEDDLEGNFQAWIYDVICESNIIESIHYVPDREDYTKIIPEIILSDLRN